jgi:hypothetical protein
MTVAACATDVVDPVPAPAAPEVQRDPPEQQLSTELRDPAALLIGGMGIDRGLDHVPQVRPDTDEGPWPETP